MNRSLTDRELQVVSAWWHTGTVKEAAQFLGLAESTVKNMLYSARHKTGPPNTLLLAKAMMGEKAA